ncbi:hypothetical protein GCM10010519_38080 [Streptomyces lactacystinicus]
MLADTNNLSDDEWISNPYRPPERAGKEIARRTRGVDSDRLGLEDWVCRTAAAPRTNTAF